MSRSDVRQLRWVCVGNRVRYSGRAPESPLDLFERLAASFRHAGDDEDEA